MLLRRSHVDDKRKYLTKLLGYSIFLVVRPSIENVFIIKNMFLLHIFDADGKAVMAAATKQINRQLDTEEFISDPEMWGEHIAKVVACNDDFPELTRGH